MPPKTLNIAETQVCVGAVGDEYGNGWYHLVFIQRLSEQGKWIACNADLEVEVVDLDDSKVVPLTRNQPAPAWCRANLYGIDAGAFGTTEEPEQVRHPARHLLASLVSTSRLRLVSLRVGTTAILLTTSLAKRSRRTSLRTLLALRPGQRCAWWTRKVAAKIGLSDNVL